MILAALALTLFVADRPPEPPPCIKGESKRENLEVDLVLFGPGRDVTEWFGHTALVARS